MSDMTLECDIAVIGGGLGGVAAAMAACEAGMAVVLSDEYTWLGGQMTSQGVSALDEHEHIECFGGTRSYYDLRQRIRDHYQTCYATPAQMPDGAPLNPGNGWVSRLCFEPTVAGEAIEAMLRPHVEAGRLTILRRFIPVAAEVSDDRVNSVTVATALAPRTTHPIFAKHFLDATDLGDLLPLTKTEYVTGVEARSDTDEHFAAPFANPDEVQSFTYCFAVEYCPSESHVIAKPPNYAANRDNQPYSLTLIAQDGVTKRPFRMFETGPTGLPPFWSYRRIIDSRLINHPALPNDVALINWPGNDYSAGDLIGKSAAERVTIEQAAKELALGFLYWLQTEAPRADGGFGYPELKLRPDLMGTADGLSQAPYIRESRRILARRRIVEQDVRAKGNTLARSRPFTDSCGVGYYPLDLHAAVGNPRNLFEPTRPYQISLGALIPQRMVNLLAACKNLGVTHVSNGAYRLHPVEWNIGEAAGALAAFCCQHGVTPAHVDATPALLRQFQRHLLNRGMPLAWTIDISPDDPLFVTTQLLVLAGAILPSSPLAQRLNIEPESPLSQQDQAALLMAAQTLAGPNSNGDTVSPLLLECKTWREFCVRLEPILEKRLRD